MEMAPLIKPRGIAGDYGRWPKGATQLESIDRQDLRVPFQTRRDRVDGGRGGCRSRESLLPAAFA
jgi:hypothetical protein